MRRLGLFLTALAILSPVLSSMVYGQVATSSVDGTVLDASGAAIPEAEVVVANTGTGFERRLQTTGAGLFAAPDLPPGPGYTITATFCPSMGARRAVLSIPSHAVEATNCTAVPTGFSAIERLTRPIRPRSGSTLRSGVIRPA